MRSPSSQGVILFIDELHTLVGAGARPKVRSTPPICSSRPSLGASSSASGRPRSTSIANTSKRTARWSVGSRPSTSSAPSFRTETIEILKGLRNRDYEEHHNVSSSAMTRSEAATKLSDRYITDRFLPDKAIDVDRRSRLPRPPPVPTCKPRRCRSSRRIWKRRSGWKFDEQLRILSHRQEFEKCQRRSGIEKDNTIEEDRGQDQRVAGVGAERAKSNVRTIERGQRCRLHRFQMVRHPGHAPRGSRDGAAQTDGRGTPQDASSARKRPSRLSAKRDPPKLVRRPQRPQPPRSVASSFSGPTGVGKTELAKALAQLPFRLRITP